MKGEAGYTQGGDAKAIASVANSYYGSFRNMFRAHGWDAPPEKMMTSAPAKIVGEYGSIRAFEEAHRRGDGMFPMEAIKAKPPNVWLTSFYGFRPKEWGFLGFTPPHQRKTFLEQTKSGVLVVIYGAGKANKDELGKVIGIQQCSHEIGDARDFMAPAAYAAKQADPEDKAKWNYGVRATRAWRVAPESRMPIQDFAPEATATEAWQFIGSQGVRLSPQEASRILKLELQEVDVYGGTLIIGSTAGPALNILAPSKAGPVSQTPYVTKEAEGPKHLYILKLEGNADAFLGYPAHGKLIIKAGFSGNPGTRCEDLNRALPECAFHWTVLRSGFLSGYERHPTSQHAKAGERVMQQVFCATTRGKSLGGEFFLVEEALIEEAWSKCNAAAKAYKS